MLSPKLALRQTTSLVMTPQLQQAIKLLQMSNQELAEYVADEIEQNPLLERESADGGLERGETDPSESRNDAEPPSPGADTPSESDVSFEPDSGSGTGADTAADLGGNMEGAEPSPASADGPLDTDFENVWTNDDRNFEEAPPLPPSDWGSGGSFDGGGMDLEDRTSETETLRDHLSAQINLEIADPGDRLIAAALIDAVDEAGYVAAPLAEIADRLGVNETAVVRVLAVVQEFDPPGVFARDLAECLALQLKDRNRFDPAMECLLQRLDLLAAHDFRSLRAACGVDDEDLSEMIQEIRALDPKPGLAFGSAPAQPVIPDILLRNGADGGWLVELNPDTLPRVLINRSYYAEISGTVRDKAARSYLTERLQAASWLTRALHQRANTILKVASAIVETQNGFFEDGIGGLRPLTLRRVADEIGMHESTVSRVTTNKYIATPRGVFELKFFFSQALGSSTGGEDHSAAAVRHRIKELIEKETSKSILSDDRIVELLSAEGIDIARRTVAKYREALHIPSSVQRRRQKAAAFQGRA